MGPLLLQRVVEELNEGLAGGVVSRVSQPDGRTLIIKFFLRGSTFALLISTDPASPRLHLIKEEAFSNPPAPLRFCAFLRSRVNGARVLGVSSIEGERIARIGLAKGHGAAEERFTLIAELTGKSANVILTDANGVVLDSLKRFPRETSARAVEPGLFLEPLPPFEPGAAEEQVDKGPQESWNEAAERLYSALAANQSTFALARSLKRVIVKAGKKAQRKLSNLRSDRERAATELSFYRFGELLASNLNRARRGMDAVEVEDYTKVPPEKVSVPLDTKLTPRENMERYFKRARKAKVALDLLKERIPRVKDEAEYVATLLFELEDASGAEDLRAIEDELTEGGYIKAVMEKRKEKSAEPVRRYESSEGFEVLCGKNGRGNDMLVKEYASREDLWFHISHLPGSHVLIKVAGRGSELTKKTITEAASLAAWHSKARAAGKVEVVYTEAKHVRKPPGAKPGMVTISDFKSIMVWPKDMVEKE